MMQAMPITFCLFTSTKGHWDRKTDWKLTINHWNRQIPLNYFNLIAHIKISEGDEEIGKEMNKNLTSMGFKVIETLNNWSRGTSHGSNYLSDMCTVSKFNPVYERPYFLLVEDDSLAISHELSLENLLLKSCEYLSKNHEMLTIRLRRREDDIGPIIKNEQNDSRFFWSKDTNFQPLLMRSLDYYRLCIILESNPEACQNIQCELLWRLILDNFSRSPYKHMVWEVNYAETIHLGIPQIDYEKIVDKYNLK